MRVLCKLIVNLTITLLFAFHGRYILCIKFDVVIEEH